MAANGAPVVLAGAGYWGKNLARNLYDLGALKAICDSNESVREKYLNQYPGIQWFSNFDEVLSDGAVEAVVLATPANTHGTMVKRSLEAGKDVFVEKPLCLSQVEAEMLVGLARDKKKILMVGHLLWYHPAVLKLKKMIESGELGILRAIYSNRLSLGKIRTEENVLWSLSPHDISVVLGLAGTEPVSVRATGASYLQKGIEDTVHIHLAFSDNLNAYIFVSWLHPFKEQKLVVIGSKKMAVFDDTKKSDKLVLYEHKVTLEGSSPSVEKGEAQTLVLDNAEPLRQECRHFLDCLRTRNRPRTDGVEALGVLKVLEMSQTQLTEAIA